MAVEELPRGMVRCSGPGGLNPPGTVGEDTSPAYQLDMSGLRRQWTALWTGLTPEDFYQLRSSDGHFCTSLTAKSEEAQHLVYQVTRWCNGRHQIPADLKCSRTFLLEPRDAAYVERTSAYLFDAEGVPPGLDDESFLDVTVTSDRAWSHRAAWSLSLATGRLISPGDAAIFQKNGFAFRKLAITGPDSHRTRLAADWESFPPLPSVVHEHPPVAGLEMPMPRVAYYFAAVCHNGVMP